MFPVSQMQCKTECFRILRNAINTSSCAVSSQQLARAHGQKTWIEALKAELLSTYAQSQTAIQLTCQGQCCQCCPLLLKTEVLNILLLMLSDFMHDFLGDRNAEITHISSDICKWYFSEFCIPASSASTLHIEPGQYSGYIIHHPTET